MGYWGTGLYQNDTAEDVRDSYVTRLKKGEDSAQITASLMQEFDLEDEEDGPVFWMALADTQWNWGRLEPAVREKALQALASGEILEWETAAQKRARQKVLQKLEQKLNTPQPDMRPIRQSRMYVCPWQIGDVFALPLCSEAADAYGLKGEYLLLRKVSEARWHPGHVCPVVHIKFSKNGILPRTTAEWDALPYIQLSHVRYEERGLPGSGGEADQQWLRQTFETDEFGFLPEYRMKLITTSKRILPKELIFLGNFANCQPPDKEFVRRGICNVLYEDWKDLEKCTLALYQTFNLELADCCRHNEQYVRLRRNWMPPADIKITTANLPKISQLFNEALEADQNY